MRRFPIAVAPITLALALSACAAQNAPPVASAPAPKAEPASDGVAPSELVAKVDIPYEKFVLANGLTTIVHTDRKAPIVGVTLYYRVGSKHEPRGRTGFAHLYEHLFFGGSANVPDFDVPLETAGSTSTNGSTSFDRTNYVETVPTGALDLALFMESDRMGYLLPAVTQDKLDKQRGVVQNEKRQGDNQPYALGEYALNDGLFPVGHPYRHSPIGSMADLDAATISDVRKWFTENYGPNNVVLALSGDIDAATARPLVEKWFGAIPKGPDISKVAAGPVTLAAPQTREIVDQVPLTQITRNWSGPGLNDPDAPALQIGMHILGGLASSRLDNALVRGQEVAVSVTASAYAMEQVSFIGANMDIKPGVDRAVAEAALDKVIADYLRDGPTEDEVRRAVMSAISGEIAALERVGGFGGKGSTLAEGEIYSANPAHYKQNLAAMAALTPQQVHAAMQRWLSRPALAVNTVPGERIEDGATMGGWGDETAASAPKPDKRVKAPALAAAPLRTAPPVAPVSDLDFPAIERAKLSNGIPIVLARRTAVPRLVVAMDFDAGYAADALNTPGTQSLMLGMLDEGTETRNATEMAEAQERLGASISTGGSLDTSSVSLSALSANLAPSLALMAEVVRHPAFREADVARVREQHLADLSQAQATPTSLARRTMDPILYGAHPYGQPSDGMGDAASVQVLTPASLRAAHDQWIRPDLARITVVGDTTMAELLPLLERAFGQWQPPAMPRPVKSTSDAIPAASPRIVLIDRPNSPQSVVLAGKVLPLNGMTPDKEDLALANEVLGDGFLSRLNLDLREDKGWSYGVRSGLSRPIGPRALLVQAPVQADRTGDSIKAILAGMKAFPATKPISIMELARVTEGNIRGLPNQFETNADVASAIRANERFGRPDDYYQTIPARYRAIGNAAINAAAKQYLQPQGLTFVVVGDRKIVEPQLRGLGLPIEVRKIEE